MGEYIVSLPSQMNRISAAEHEPLFIVPAESGLSSLPKAAEASQKSLPPLAGHLHCSYTIAGLEGAPHACVCWTDSSGRTLDVACLPCVGMSLEECVQLIWEHGSRQRARQIAENGTLRVAVVKGGSLSQEEAQAWEATVSDGEQRDGREAPTKAGSGSTWQRRLPLPVTHLNVAPHRDLNLGADGAVSVLCVRGTCAPPPLEECAAGLYEASARLSSGIPSSSGSTAQLLLPEEVSSTSCTAFLLQSDLVLELELCLLLTHASSVQKPSRVAGCDSVSHTCSVDERSLFRLVCTDLHRLTWLNAIPPSGPSSSFEQRWSELPVHCAIVDRLAEFVEWMFVEGLSAEGSSEEDDEV